MKNYASFWQRFAAIFIDGLLFGFLFARSKSGLVPILQLSYSTWMLGMYGATVGKMVMKIKVVKENKSKLTYSDALLREITKYLSAAILLLGYLTVIWDKKKQGWHDKIAKTIVVEA
jgi:uncharacterized RDD family membrane protein YckC